MGIKTGIVLQVVGFEEDDTYVDHKREIKKLKLKADDVIFISPTAGYMDVYTAWLELTKKGIEKVILKQARITNRGFLELIGKELLLQEVV